MLDTVTNISLPVIVNQPNKTVEPAKTKTLRAGTALSWTVSGLALASCKLEEFAEEQPGEAFAVGFFPFIAFLAAAGIIGDDADSNNSNNNIGGAGVATASTPQPVALPNLAPIIAIEAAASDTADLTDNAAAQTAATAMIFDDPNTEDPNDALTIIGVPTSSTTSAAAAATSSSGPGAETITTASGGVTVDGAYGSFVITRDDNTGTLSVTYTLDDTDTAVIALDDTGKLYDTVTLFVVDDDGLQDSQEFQVTINGANDNPDIRFASGAATSATGRELFEDDPNAQSFTTTIDFSDPDITDTNATLTVHAVLSKGRLTNPVPSSTAEVTAGRAIGNVEVGVGASGADEITDSFGKVSFSRTETTMTVTIELDFTKSVYNSFGLGDTEDRTLTFWVTDNQGAQDSLIFHYVINGEAEPLISSPPITPPPIPDPIAFVELPPVDQTGTDPLDTAAPTPDVI